MTNLLLPLSALFVIGAALAWGAGHNVLNPLASERHRNRVGEHPEERDLGENVHCHEGCRTLAIEEGNDFIG